MTFHIPAALREFTGGRSQIQLEHASGSLNEVLAALWQMYPGIRDRMVTEQGQLRAHINIFIGDENVRYTGGLATQITSESIISIVPAVSGG